MYTMLNVVLSLFVWTPAVRDDSHVLVKVGDYYAEIVDVGPKRVTIEFDKIPGSRATLLKDNVPPDKLYLFRKNQIDEDDPDAWMKLADFAGEHGLHMRRIEALRRAKQLAPDRTSEIDVLIARTRATCAASRIADARELLKSGNLSAAIEELEETVAHFANCDAGGQAKALLARIRSQLRDEKQRARDEQARRKELRRKLPALERIAGYIDKGNTELQLGRHELDENVDATNHFETAVSDFERARDRLHELAGSSDEDVPMQVVEERQRLERLARQKLVTAHIELGFVYVNRGDSHSALRHAGRAAELDPANARVDRLRIAIAALGRQ